MMCIACPRERVISTLHADTARMTVFIQVQFIPAASLSGAIDAAFELADYV